MSNPTFNAGAAITFECGAKIEKRRVVKINAQGKIEHAAATGGFFGAVTEPGDKEAKRPANFMGHGRPSVLAVHRAGAVVPLEVTTGQIKAGKKVFLAADGKVAGTGTVQCGVAVRDSGSGHVETMLLAPVAE